MGYYSDTTKKLMAQIGEPYVTTVRQGGSPLDLSSLIMALAFMPQASKAFAGPQVNPIADSMALLGMHKNQPPLDAPNQIYRTPIGMGGESTIEQVLRQIFGIR
jgi:hypothetical protein